MRDETVEIMDSKGQKLRLQISTPGFFAKVEATATRDDREIIQVKLTGWDKTLWNFNKGLSGNWKSSDVGFLKYHAGKVYRQESHQGDLTTRDIYLANTEGTWGIKLFNYEDMFGVNDAGEGTVAVTWITSLAEGRFSWSLV